MFRNQKGFTLLEIIAVLVILGILAAVAVPKYFNMQDDARASAAQSAISEVKARANQYYAAITLRNGTPPTLAVVQASVTSTPDVGGDFGVATALGTGLFTITVNTVKGVALTAPVVGTWTYPTAP